MKEDATTAKPIVITPDLRKRFTGISVILELLSGTEPAGRGRS
jgi:hypothetical protein